MAEVAQQDHTIETVAQIGAVEDVSIEVRARVAAQILQGHGSVEDVVTQLAAALGKNVTFKLAEEASSGEEEAESIVVEVVDVIPEQGEQLDERLTACLEQLRGDFDRGIVRIEAKGTLESYAAALKADKTAGQTWEAIEAKLRANNAQKLRLAAAMPEGACLIGVYEDGEPAIRQRSREIVNVIVTKEGKLVTLPHAEAVQRVASTREQYGKAVEIVKGVKEAGYRVPADSPNYEKEGLVAASDAVMGGNYVESPVTSDPRNREWRSTMLECPENTPDSSAVRVVYFDPNVRRTNVYAGDASARGDDRGAVLWL